ncbi:hypothetical protein Taro_007861 [Colocasia esculenta]|uniref:Uncharacterized protein n=1 Tax=Colocasia esculenta TaxID=4460 RepID=A0A843TWN5_COLES|nr:hypothetical protein [Colocasia esculenta]
MTEEVVSVSWDPHPREPVEGGIRAMSVLELAAHKSDSFYAVWWCSEYSGRAMCAGIGRQSSWGLSRGVPCVLVPAALVLVTSQMCRFRLVVAPPVLFRPVLCT